MSKNKNIKIFALIATICYGSVSEMYADIIDDILMDSNQSIGEKCDQYKNKIESDLQALNNIGSILSNQGVNNLLINKYNKFCEAKENRNHMVKMLLRQKLMHDEDKPVTVDEIWKLIKQDLTSDEDELVTVDKIWKLNERCYEMAENCLKDSITIIEDACKNNRNEIRTINSSITTVIDNTLKPYDDVQSTDKPTLNVTDRFSHFVDDWGLEDVLKYPSIVKVSQNKIDSLSSEAAAIEEYRSYCHNVESLLHKNTDKALEKVNLERIRLLQKASMNYLEVEDDQYKALVTYLSNKQTNSNNNSPAIQMINKQTNSNNNATATQVVNKQTNSNNNATVIQMINKQTNSNNNSTPAKKQTNKITAAEHQQNKNVVAAFAAGLSVAGGHYIATNWLHLTDRQSKLLQCVAAVSTFFLISSL